MKRIKNVNEFSVLSVELANFLLVYEHKGINAAARKIGQDPGNFSRMLARLEASFGSELFVRHQSGLKPTASAERLYRALTNAKQEFAKQISVDPEEKRKIRIGFSPTVGFTYFSKYFLNGVVDLNMQPEFHLASSIALLEAIKKRELDFIIVANAPKFPGTITKSIAKENLVLASLNGNRGKILVVSVETIGLERIAKSVVYDSRWVMNDYFLVCKFLLEGPQFIGIVPESLLDAFPKLNAIDVFQREGKITVVTWPGSTGVELLRWAKS